MSHTQDEVDAFKKLVAVSQQALLGGPAVSYLLDELVAATRSWPSWAVPTNTPADQLFHRLAEAIRDYVASKTEDHLKALQVEDEKALQWLVPHRK